MDTTSEQHLNADSPRRRRGALTVAVALAASCLSAATTHAVDQALAQPPAHAPAIHPRPAPTVASRNQPHPRLPLPAPTASTPSRVGEGATPAGRTPPGTVPHDLRETGWQRWLTITAYCATGNRTASGAWPQLGDAATLDRTIPFGTRLLVAGRLYVVRDRIGYGSDIDLYYGASPTCTAAADRWGRRQLLVREVRP